MVTRRTLLRAGPAAALAAVAGCTSLGSGAGSGGDGDGGEGTPRGLTLPSLDVGGSPGGKVRVQPSDTVVLLDFWATWCAPCKPQMAELRSVHGQFPDVHVLSITNETDEAAIEAFWREYDGTWPVAMDPDLRTNDRYDATRIPTLLVFDRSGEEVWRHVGLAAADTIAGKLREAGAG